MKNVLILKSGTANAAVSARLGDYDRWFVQTLGQDGLRFHRVQAFLGEKLPHRARDFDAIIMTGSPLSVTKLDPWMERTGEFMVNAAEQGVPVLGVCFGHQLLAHMYGARVQRNPAGREIGTIQCELTGAGREDPLFDGLPAKFDVQATHEDYVTDVPEQVELLASNANTRAQAFRVGDRVRGVQFHPEIDAATMKALIEARLPKLEAEAQARGRAPDERGRELFAGLRATPFGKRILENFIEHFT